MDKLTIPLNIAVVKHTQGIEEKEEKTAYCIEVTVWTLTLQAAPHGDTSAFLKSHHWYDSLNTCP